MFGLDALERQCGRIRGNRADSPFCVREIVVGLVSVLPLLIAPTTAWAKHANIDLKVVSPDGKAAVHSDRTPPIGGLNRRPQLTVHGGDPLVLQFMLTNVYPHGTLKDVTVRYYVVRMKTIGQKAPPPLKEGVVTQGEVTMNFKPRCRVGARVRFHISAPGVYLVRVETRNTHSDHEHFAAIDLIVK